MYIAPVSMNNVNNNPLSFNARLPEGDLRALIKECESTQELSRLYVLLQSLYYLPGNVAKIVKRNKNFSITKPNIELYIDDTQVARQLQLEKIPSPLGLLKALFVNKRPYLPQEQVMMSSGYKGIVPKVSPQTYDNAYYYNITPNSIISKYAAPMH